jgi:hypothetical protein
MASRISRMVDNRCCMKARNPRSAADYPMNRGDMARHLQRYRSWAIEFHRSGGTLWAARDKFSIGRKEQCSTSALA